jgi:hypothetical protein
MTALLLFLLLITAACGGSDDPPPDPSNPTYLSNDAAGWAENITVKDLRRRENELNRLALGRTEVIPILLALLDHEDAEVVFGAFSALEGNLAKVERADGDVTPWLPVLEKAAASPDESLSRSATSLLAKYREE